MPLYNVSHSTPLTPTQLDALAAAITKTHTTLFTAPALFVNVRFEDLSAPQTQNTTYHYVAGKRKLGNTIMATVRGGPARSRAHYDKLCAQLKEEWGKIVSEGELDTVFVMGSIVAGWEQGFAVPEAGRDGEWIRENMGEFERRAGTGDEGMRELVEEIRARGLDG